MGRRGPLAGSEKRGPPTGIRFDPGLKARLTEAAKAARRSFADEVAFRLELSFGARDIEQEFGDLETYALCRLVASAFRDIKRQTGGSWFQQPWSFRHAKDALKQLFSYLEPVGDAVVPDDAPLLKRMKTEGFSDEAVAQAKDQLGRFPLGAKAADMAMFLIETSLVNEHTHRAEELRPIATIIKARLIAADMAGEALKELLDDDPNATIKVTI